MELHSADSGWQNAQTVFDFADGGG